ncbi:Venom allergen 5 [Caligus rogercresseyi]|uniref:Venom allergen 5 n=1 Tax=Caligus rogercresseyi TaxID=217165 RepID=A0A7T8HIY4_CALRO|nr:Venom allergen 5 [Caligus rogercresseyi]
MDAVNVISKGPNIVPKHIKQGCDYCSLSSRNTYCRYGQSETVSCVGVISAGLPSEAVKQEILNVHNDLRRNGETPRDSFEHEKLVWNEELARGAQLWSNQCRTEHDEPNTCKHKFVGQNIAWSHASGETEDPDFKTAIERWYDEINLYRGSVDSYYFNSATGHFTQLIWADTYEIGCGFVAYTGRKRRGDAIQKIYICNYGPGGNSVSSPIYKQGYQCSECPLGFGACDDSLCGPGPGGVAPTTTPSPEPYKPDPYIPEQPTYPAPQPSPPQSNYNPYNPYNPYSQPQQPYQPPSYNNNPYGYNNNPYGYGGGYNSGGYNNGGYGNPGYWNYGGYNGYGTTYRFCKNLLNI